MDIHIFHRTGRRVFVVAAVGVALAAMPAQAAPMSVTDSGALPVSVTLTPTIVSCDNTSSTIDLKADIGMGGLKLKTIFKNNTKGTKVTTVGTAETSVRDASVIGLPKQPVQGGTGGNPYISVAIAKRNASGDLELLTQPEIIGRCVQGQKLFTSKHTFDLPITAGATAQALVCDSKGSKVTLDAGSAAPGFEAVVVFDNNKNEVVHRSIQETDAVVSLVGGQTHKGWGQVGGAGGNPLVYLQFDDGVADTTNPEFFLGRCKDLM